MPKVNVVNQKNESVGEIELPDSVFGTKVNHYVLHEVVKAQLASKRAGTASTKTRSEVRGSTKKLSKQKGTGRARHGSIKAPIYVGGGKAHGPKPRSYAFRPNRKVRQNALKSALSHKVENKSLIVVDRLDFEAIKTKNLMAVLGNLKAQKSSLIIDQEENRNLYLCARNLPKHSVLPPAGLNVFDILKADFLIVAKDSIQEIEQRFAE